MKVGDLVQSTKNGAGIGDSWVEPGHLGIVIEIFNQSSKRSGRKVVGVMIPGLGKSCHYFLAGWEVISENR